MRFHRRIPVVGLSLALALAGEAAITSSASAKPASCNSTFTVQHNDSSGGAKLPRGLYRVTSSTLSCPALASDFRTFLLKYNGAIPGWKATVFGTGHAKYQRKSNGQNFTVKLIKAKKK